MKKILILALALILNTNLCFAQENVKLNGRYKEYWPNTKNVKVKYKLKNGQINGKYTEYHPNGIIKAIAKYKNGVIEGIKTTYYDSSKMHLKETYVDGLKHGTSYTYSPFGKLIGTTTYYRGKKQGYGFDYTNFNMVEKYYDNDELAFEREYKGKSEELIQETKYYKDGDKKITKYHDLTSPANKQSFLAGKKNEKIKEIVERTKYISFETLYIKKENKTINTTNFYNYSDKLIYQFKETNKKLTSSEEYDYDDYGNLKVKKRFINNFTSLKLTSYHPNGNVDLDGQYKQNPTTKKYDIPEGTFYTYNTSGKMLSKAIYENGYAKEASIWIYYPNGQCSSAGHYLNGKMNGVQTFYFENGIIGKKSTYLNGQLHGKSTIYRPSGRVEVVANYSNGKLNGNKTIYDINGNIEAKLTLKNGKLDGTSYIYWDNGKIKSKGIYINDKREGSFVEYYRNGIMKSNFNFKNNKPHGVCKTYWENGNYSYIDVYNNGELKSKKAFNMYGKQLWSQKY